MRKQVDKSHYNFNDYMDKRRWASVWHQLDEVMAQQSDNVLEIGIGSGIFKSAAATFDLNVNTIDIDPELDPDCVASATDIRIIDRAVDVDYALQVLEHMPFEASMRALREMCRIARKAVVISPPDVETSWASTLTIPKLGTFRFALPCPGLRPRRTILTANATGSLNKLGFTKDRVTREIRKIATEYLPRTYRAHENQYHRFYIPQRQMTTITALHSLPHNIKFGDRSLANNGSSKSTSTP